MKQSAIGLSLLVAVCTSMPSFGAVLFEENFDVDPTANWNVNVAVVTDFSANFAFDYGTVGIPEAPNSTGSTPTTGLKMYANKTTGVLGGGSVSPTGLDLGTGDYVLTFDWWQNFQGPAPGPTPVSQGTTQISYGGILSSGTAANFAGGSDSVFFAQTLDGGSSADWRVYSSDAAASYQALDATNGTFVYEASFGGTDNTARNASNPYYFDRAAGTGPLPGNTIPAAQTALFPAEQTGTAQDGITAFSWALAEIIKIGNFASLKVNGLLIASVDTSGFVTATAGNNILFGHSDTNNGSASDALFSTLTFSLFDNIKVVDLVSALAGDLNLDGFVGVDDLNVVLINWNQNVTPGNLGTGDPSGDGFVGVDDLNVVLINWNNGTPRADGAEIPEPASLALLGMGGVAMLRRRR